MPWFDALPKVRRAFINEYGAQAYKLWLDLNKAGHMNTLRQYEIKLREKWKLSPGSPIVDEYERNQ